MDLATYKPNRNFLLYKTSNGDVKVDVLLHNETIWMLQKKIAELFDVNVPAISKHFKNIFDSGELQKKATVSILEIVQTLLFESDFDKMINNQFKNTNKPRTK